LILATTIHQKPAAEIIKPSQLERVKAYSPKLFFGEKEEEKALLAETQY
jgi:hypothetical protein